MLYFCISPHLLTALPHPSPLNPHSSPRPLTPKPTHQREIASCCSTSEWLLWYAQSARVGKQAGEGVSRQDSVAKLPAGSLSGGIAMISSQQHRAQHPRAQHPRAQPALSPWETQSRPWELQSRPWEIPVRKTSALEPDRSHYTLLREAAHACERSLSKRRAQVAASNATAEQVATYILAFLSTYRLAMPTIPCLLPFPFRRAQAATRTRPTRSSCRRSMG